MRSRYTAYYLGDESYILKTWHPSTRPSEASDNSLSWSGLKVMAYLPLSGTKARVKFIAKGKDSNGKWHTLREDSAFTKENGNWLYVDGKFF